MDYTDGDYAHMEKVIGYVHRHHARRQGDVRDSRWRCSLMNSGHDPAEGREPLRGLCPCRLTPGRGGGRMPAAMVPLSLVIFDCDGVLIDSEPIGSRIDAEELQRCGIDITPGEILERFTGVTSRQMFRVLSAERGIELPADLEARVQERVHAAFERELLPIPGVHAVLDALDLPAGVASGSRMRRLEVSLGVTGLYERFRPHVFSAEMVAHGKPAPDLFLHVAATMAVAPERCLVIEDSLNGVLAARAASMPVIGFTGGTHCRPDHGLRLRAAGALDVVGRMADLLPAIDRLRRAGRVARREAPYGRGLK